MLSRATCYQNHEKTGAAATTRSRLGSVTRWASLAKRNLRRGPGLIHVSYHPPVCLALDSNSRRPVFRDVVSVASALNVREDRWQKFGQ